MLLATLLLAFQGIIVPPQDADGWTKIPVSPDTLEVYVSSSTGSNVNNGLSPATPLATIEAAIAKIKDHSADHILLKCGDAWPDVTFTKRGRSFQEPIVLTSYGTGPRPLIGDTVNGGAFMNTWSSSPGLQNLFIIGIKFQGTGPAGEEIMTFMNSSENVLLEDCDVAGVGNSDGFCLVLDGTNFVIRRNIFHDAGQGIYEGWETDFVLLEQNYFFNFWDNDYGNWRHATYFDNENMINGHQPTIVMNENVVGNVEHTGLQARCGADMTNNTVFRCGVGMSLGGSNDYPVGAGYATGDVTDNVILHGTTYTTPWALSWGFITNACDGVNFSRNIIANNDIANGMDIASPRGISLYGIQLGLPQYPHGVRNMTMNDNIIYNWGEDPADHSSGLTMNCDPDYSFNIKIERLDIQEPIANEWTCISYDPSFHFPFIQTKDCRFLGQPTLYGLGGAPATFSAWKSAMGDIGSFETQVQYRFPQLTIPLYNQIVCGGQPTFDDFIDRCQQQRKGNWKLELTSAKINSTFRRAFTAQ